ncbi:MAG: hypothetical protein KAI24_00465 [Planctomycetes bacterium]|nr:hypothetical protein [Planctomycetota bacterium]
MTPAPEVRRSSATGILLTVTLVAACFTAYQTWANHARLAEQAERLTASEQLLQEVLGEVTRMRIEQRAEGKGAAALIEKLQVYAPLMSDARVPEPDYQNAKKEIVAILRAFESLGKERAWQPVMARIEEADPRKDFEEVKWLLEVAVRLDLEAGKQLVKDVMLGLRLPNPRLRWFASRIMTERDKPLAQQLLRRILMTESSRGVNLDRAGQHGMAIPDQAAFAVTGFNNFVTRYLQTDDPKTEDTLIQLLHRVEHDQITIQECVKELGRRKCERALDLIKKLYDDPPLDQQNPLFLGHVIDAVATIGGKDEIAWLESKLPTAATDVIAARIQHALDCVRAGKPIVPQATTPRPK